MSVFNAGRLLRRSIESILAQSFDDFELIVINDGSTDGSDAVLREFANKDRRIVYLENPRNFGLTASLNLGLRKARGNYIARQDADDVSLPDRFAAQVAFLERRSDVGLLGSAYHVMRENGHILNTYTQPAADTEIRWQMLFHNAFCHSSVMFRRELVHRDGCYYDESLPYSQDYDLWTKMLKVTLAANLQEPLVVWRKRSNDSISSSFRGLQQQIATKISRTQIERLTPDISLSLAEVETLRWWYYNFPSRLSPREVPLCVKLLKLLKVFCMKYGRDSERVLEIQRDWIRRILGAISPVVLLNKRGACLIRELSTMQWGGLISKAIKRRVYPPKRKV